jgi:adenylate kinase family enzyme
MKISIIGAPGAGKTHIAKIIANELNLRHIEADQIFWSGADLRSEVSKLIEEDNWIFEGHMSKLADLVLPKSDKIIVLHGSNILSLARAVKRDWRQFTKVWHNIQFYEKLATKRAALIDELISSRPHDVLILNNFPDLTQSELAAFCEDLKPAAMKTKKPAVKG